MGAAQLARPEPIEPPVLRQGGVLGIQTPEVHAALWNPRTPSARVEGTPRLITSDEMGSRPGGTLMAQPLLA